MDEKLEANKKMWNALTGPHVKSTFYDVEGFKAGRIRLHPLERKEMGDVSEKSLLHLMCHFGLDTLSWARLGAKTTGIDFSNEAINYARKLAKEVGINAKFICSDIYDLPEVLDGQYDIVFTSYGVLCWLPDLKKWAEIIVHFLKPGGYFYIAEIHPMTYVIGERAGKILGVTNSYFPTGIQERYEGGADYASDFTHDLTSYEWQHPVSTVLNSLTQAGLKIEYLHEFPFCCVSFRKDMYQDKDGWWRLKGDKVPLTYSIKASKPL